MRNLLVATLAAVAALTIVTCATPPLEGIDAPGAMLDVPGLRLDATPDASADVIDAECLPSTSSVDYGDGRFTRTTTYYAEVPAPTGFDPMAVSQAIAIECDWERFGTPGSTTCPTGATCVDAPTRPASECRYGVSVDFAEGRLRAFCGSRNQGQGVAPPGTPAPYDSGERARLVRFVVQ